MDNFANCIALHDHSPRYEDLWVVAGSFIGWQTDLFSAGLTNLQLLGGDLQLDNIHLTPDVASRILPGQSFKV